MARRRKNARDIETAPVVFFGMLAFLGFLAIKSPGTFFSGLFFILLGLTILAGCLVAWVVIYPRWKRRQRLRTLELEGVDRMHYLEFEEFVAELLRAKGYSAHTTPGSGDFGADVVAERDGCRWSVQCKLYRGGVDRTAVSDAVAAKDQYRCSRAMVVTNSSFTPGAVTFAATTKCELVDRNTLAAWINETRASPSNRPRLMLPISLTGGACVAALILLTSGMNRVSLTASSTPYASLAGVVPGTMSSVPEDRDFGRLGQDRIQQLELERLAGIINQRAISKSELDGFSNQALTVLRNLPYARKGLAFKRADLRDYFSQCQWYRPDTDDVSLVEKRLNRMERTNIAVIAAIQKSTRL